MITLSQCLNDILAEKPLLEEYLGKGLLNYSAFAREIKPEVENRLLKNVSEGSILVALKRLSHRLPKEITNFDIKSYIKDITVKSNFVELTYLFSPTLKDAIHALYLRVVNNKDFHCTHSQGITEATIIVNKDYEEQVKKIFGKEKLLERIYDVSAIILKLTDETVTSSGIYYTILKKLALAKINVWEMISTTHELTILFKEKDIQQAFSVLREL